MANTVLEQVSVRAMNVDALNCDAIYADGNLSNGSVFTRGAISATAGNGELFTVVAPTTTTLANLWMACSPEVVVIASATGLKYTGLSVDPRDFTNLASQPIAAFQPQVGDLIKNHSRWNNWWCFVWFNSRPICRSCQWCVYTFT